MTHTLTKTSFICLLKCLQSWILKVWTKVMKQAVVATIQKVFAFVKMRPEIGHNLGQVVAEHQIQLTFPAKSANRQQVRYLKWKFDKIFGMEEIKRLETLQIKVHLLVL